MARTLVIGLFILFATLGLALALAGGYLASVDGGERGEALAAALSVAGEASEAEASIDDEATIGQVLGKGALVLVLLAAFLGVLKQLHERIVVPGQRRREDRE